MSANISFDYLYNRSANLYWDSGAINFSRRGELISYADQDKITFNKKDAWNEAVKLSSSLEFLLPPIRSTSKVEVYLREQYRSINFIRSRDVSEEQFNLQILEWDPLNFHNDMHIYDSTIKGVSNITRFEGFSLFISLPNFAKGIPSMIQSRMSIDFKNVYL